jgi:hypothetical protein
VFILNILVPHTKEGSTEKTFTTLHTFDQKGLYNTMYGIGYGKGKNPVVNVVDAAAKWLHENNRQVALLRGVVHAKSRKTVEDNQRGNWTMS